jgi:flagellar basal body-associated protein FliL
MSEEQNDNENSSEDKKSGFFEKPFFILAKAKFSEFLNKLKIKKLFSRLPDVDFNDKKNLVILVLVIFIVVFAMAFFLFSNGGGEEKQGDSVVSEKKAQPNVSRGRAESYIALLPDKDVKEREFMATVRGEEKGSSKVLRFSISLGLDKKILEEDIRENMAPLMSEALRFLSQKTENEIIEMIQEERTEDLVKSLNDVLIREGIDLEGKGRVVSISFTTYFFVSI